MGKAIATDISRLRKTKCKVASAASTQMSLESTLNNSINGAEVMKSVQTGVETMRKMNAGLNPAQMHRMGASFSAEMDKMQLANEVVDDAMYMQSGSDDEEEEESNQIMNEVLQGLALDAPIPGVVQPKPHLMKAQESNVADSLDNLNLEERLKRLMDN